MTKDQIFEFFRRLAEDNPEPETELEYGNAYQLTVAVALSAQATDVGVNKATRALFAKVKTPQQMLDLGLEGLTRADQDHRAVQLQSQECHRAFTAVDRRIWRRGARHPRESGAAARSGA